MDLFEYADHEARRDPDETPDDPPVPAAGEDPMGPSPLPPASGAAAAHELREKVTTLADALRAVAALPDVPTGRLADWRSAVATFARVTGSEPESMAIAPASIVPVLKAVRPGRFHLRAKTWGNIRSSLAGLAAAVGWHAGRDRMRLEVRGEWSRLLDLVPHSPQKANLRGFARYCQTQRIEPDQVTEATIEGYRAWRATETYDLSPNSTIHGLRRIWNRNAGRTQGWPARKLAPPPDPRVFAFPLDAFPSSFAADLEGFVEIMRNPDPFETPDARQLATNTWQDRRGHLIRAGSILVREGVLRIEDVTGLDVLVAPSAMKAILLHMHRKAGRSWNGNAAELALTLFDIARRWLKLDDTKLAELDKLRSVVKSGKRGIGKRSQRRLAAFDDPQMLKRFFRLPGELFQAADRLHAESRLDEAARLHERALALALLQLQPLRRRTLALIDVEKHFRRDLRGRYVSLEIPAELQKNGVEVSAPVPDDLGRRIAKHIRVHLPHLRGETGGTWLFPGSTGAGHKEPGTLGKGVSKEVERALGIEFSLHMVRHVAAMVLYDSSPDAGPVAQRLLAHRQLSTTESFYGRLKTRSAHGAWGEILEGMRAKERIRKGVAAKTRGAGGQP